MKTIIRGNSNLNYYKKWLNYVKSTDKAKCYLQLLFTSFSSISYWRDKITGFYLIFGKMKIASILPFWDFMTENSVTSNEDN